MEIFLRLKSCQPDTKKDGHRESGQNHLTEGLHFFQGGWNQLTILRAQVQIGDARAQGGRCGLVSGPNGFSTFPPLNGS